MSPEERQLLQGLFDRMRSAAGNPRDQEAEAFISDNVRQQPYAPYLLSQTVIVQDQALRAANDKLQQLEAQLQQMQPQGAPAQQPGSGGFLSGIGAMFGGGSSQPQPRSPWNQGGQPQGYPPQQGNYAPPPQQGGPWGGQPQQASGGGFLHGALGAAAGVAGGVLLADSIRGLFGGHNNGLGIASGVPGMGGGFGGGGETITNNYYGSDTGGSGTAADYQQDADQDQDDAQDSGDYSSDV
jgi:hypothetical protein